MNNVVVQIPDRWQRFANSRLLVVVTALTCLSLSFGPVFLFQLAKAGVPHTDPRVIFGARASAFTAFCPPVP